MWWCSTLRSAPFSACCCFHDSAHEDSGNCGRNSWLQQTYLLMWRTVYLKNLILVLPVCTEFFSSPRTKLHFTCLFKALNFCYADSCFFLFGNGCLFVTTLTVLQWIHLLLHARRDYTCPSLCTQHLHTDSAFMQRSTKRWRSESKHRLHMQREWDKAWLRRPDGSEALLSLQQESSAQH